MGRSSFGSVPGRDGYGQLRSRRKLSTRALLAGVAVGVSGVTVAATMPGVASAQGTRHWSALCATPGWVKADAALSSVFAAAIDAGWRDSCRNGVLVRNYGSDYGLVRAWLDHGSTTYSARGTGYAGVGHDFYGSAFVSGYVKLRSSNRYDHSTNASVTWGPQ